MLHWKPQNQWETNLYYATYANRKMACNFADGGRRHKKKIKPSVKIQNLDSDIWSSFLDSSCDFSIGWKSNRLEIVDKLNIYTLRS